MTVEHINCKIQEVLDYIVEYVFYENVFFRLVNFRELSIASHFLAATLNRSVKFALTNLLKNYYTYISPIIEIPLYLLNRDVKYSYFWLTGYIVSLFYR